MTQELLRLKNDVLNELRNQKYYAQDELRTIVDNNTMSQRDKVQSVIEATEILVNIDAKIATIDAIFVSPPAPQPPAPQDDDSSSNQVNNVIETELNQQGQTHSE